MRNLRTFKEAFNERRKLPPQIIVSDESRYNKTNENNHEYEYCSWEDNTNFELKVDYNADIIECQFNFEIKIDDSTKEDLDSFKKSFENNEKPTNNGEHQNKTYYEHFLAPELYNNETCFKQPVTSIERFFVFLWFILLFTGYVDILEIFICYTVEKVDINITKLVSNSKRYRALYKSNDGRFEDNKISMKTEMNETFETEGKNNPFLKNDYSNV